MNESVYPSAGTANLGEKSKISSPVLGMSLFVATEVMFFTALVSAFLVIRAGYGTWLPPEGITLPVGITALNSLVLFASALTLFLSGKALDAGKSQKAEMLLLMTTVLGGIFVTVQGYEWIQLVKHGLTMTSSVFGATFFLLIGSHGLHVLGAVIFLGFLYAGAKKSGLNSANLAASQVFWFFVVAVWPILYGLVYF